MGEGVRFRKRADFVLMLVWVVFVGTPWRGGKSVAV